MFTAAGDSIVTLLKDDGILLWDSATFRLRAQLTPPLVRETDEQAGFRTVALSPDGRLLLAAGRYA
jgi:hypothetical protein